MYKRFGKRAFDILMALAGLTLLAAPLVVIAALLWAAGGRPVLFRQWRVGRGGRLFRILKFRTMVVRPGPDATFTVANDARVTPLGRRLRRWKLDELPQLLNVLVGDMSLVGPRPDVPGYADRLEGEARKVLSVRPGVTGPATLAFLREEELLAGADDPLLYNNSYIYPKKVEINLDYVENCSFVRDLACIWRTLFGGGRGPGAGPGRHDPPAGEADPPFPGAAQYFLALGTAAGCPGGLRPGP